MVRGNAQAGQNGSLISEFHCGLFLAPTADLVSKGRRASEVTRHVDILFRVVLRGAKPIIPTAAKTAHRVPNNSVLGSYSRTSQE